MFRIPILFTRWLIGSLLWTRRWVAELLVIEEKKKEQKMERIVQIYGLTKTWQNTSTGESHPLRFVHYHRYDKYQYKTGFR